MEKEQAMDAHWMAECLALAARGRGSTSPNPMVGALLVKDGKQIAANYHRKAGEPHAEALVLAAAGERARGGVLYVSLEPCCHVGRTPACSASIVSAGLQRVVVAMKDPNPLVAGQGIEQLRHAGIEVTVGVLQQQAERLNEAFAKFIVKQRPFVLWKVASSLDGRIDIGPRSPDCPVHPHWITGEPARREVHGLRSYADAVVTGSGTVLADNPKLTARHLVVGCSQPLRVVLDSRGRVKPSAAVFDGQAPSLWVLGRRAQPTAEQGVDLLRAPTEAIAVDWLLEKLAQRHIVSLLLECGPTLAASFIRAQAVDKVCWYTAPQLIGGQGVAALGPSGLDQGLSLTHICHRYVGQDQVLEGYVQYPGGKVGA